MKVGLDLSVSNKNSLFYIIVVIGLLTISFNLRMKNKIPS